MGAALAQARRWRDDDDRAWTHGDERPARAVVRVGGIGCRRAHRQETVTAPRSKVYRMARSLHRIALVLLVMFFVAAVAGIIWVVREFEGDADAWRYVAVVTDAGVFLVGAVVAQVGSSLVEALGRIRGSLIEAILQGRVDETELTSNWPELSETGRGSDADGRFKRQPVAADPPD